MEVTLCVLQPVCVAEMHALRVLLMFLCRLHSGEMGDA